MVTARSRRRCASASSAPRPSTILFTVHPLAFARGFASAAGSSACAAVSNPAKRSAPAAQACSTQPPSRHAGARTCKRAYTPAAAELDRRRPSNAGLTPTRRALEDLSRSQLPASYPHAGPPPGKPVSGVAASSRPASAVSHSHSQRGPMCDERNAFLTQAADASGDDAVGIVEPKRLKAKGRGTPQRDRANAPPLKADAAELKVRQSPPTRTKIVGPGPEMPAPWIPSSACVASALQPVPIGVCR